MEENKRKRVRLVDNSNLVWSQRRAEEKNAYTNTVKNDNILYRTAKAAKKAEEKLYAEKVNQAQQGQETPAATKQRQLDNRHIREGLDVRNNILRQESSLGMDGMLSFDELQKAQNSSLYVGRKKPMKVRRKDVRGLEGKMKRRKRSRYKLLPSERRSRLTRARIERTKKKYLERQARKELVITDANGKKISVERLRKLRGLSKQEAVTKRDMEFAKKYAMTKRREAEQKRSSLVIRKRDEYTR